MWTHVYENELQVIFMQLKHIFIRKVLHRHILKQMHKVMEEQKTSLKLRQLHVFQVKDPEVFFLKIIP